MNTRVIDLCHRPNSLLKRLNITIAMLGFLVVAQPASAAAILVDANGKLIGATAVNVGGALYDVAFVDGTCAEVFSGCDAVTDFTFTTLSTASAASQALLNQVFLGFYDFFPNLTSGCTDPNRCRALTPYTFDIFGSVGSAVANNLGGNTDDFVSGYLGARGDDFRAQAQFVYADFTPAATPVPEPASMLLLGTGLLGAGVRRWRQKRA